ncbi:MAG: hypothetical protein ACTSW4_01000 [Candidatus Ranarchaeia archaeon]
MAKPIIEPLDKRAFAIDSRLLKTATMNTAVTENGETDLELVKNYIDYWYRFNMGEEELALISKLYMDGTAESVTTMEIRGARLVKGGTKPHPDHADCINLLTPLFLNRILHAKEMFEEFRKVKPEHPVIQTNVGCFVPIVTQHGITLDPLAPNYGTRGQVEDEAGLFSRFPSSKEIQSYEVAAHSGNLVELQDLKSGFTYNLVLCHPEPFIRIKVQVLLEKSFLVITESSTYPQNALKFEGREVKTYAESLYKGPKALECPILDFILGEPGNMATVLGPLEFFPDFDLAYIKPALHPYNPIGTENVLESEKGFNGIETIGQL